MESLEVKSYLNRPKHIFANIVVLQEKIENLRLKMLPRAINFEKERVQTSPEDPMPNFGAEIDELDRQMANLMKEYYESMGEVEKTIREVENDDIRLILAKICLLKKLIVLQKDIVVNRTALAVINVVGLVELICYNRRYQNSDCDHNGNYHLYKDPLFTIFSV